MTSSPPEPTGFSSKTMQCLTLAEFTTYDSDTAKALARMKQNPTDEAAEELLLWLETAITFQVEIECPFDGDVEVEWYGTAGNWTCPACGTCHEFEDENDY